MQFIPVNGHVLHYEYQPAHTGRTFVFINSLGTDFRIWDEVVARLHPHGPILRFDKPGHGLSPVVDQPLTISDYAADVLGLLDALDIQACVLVGLSIGGIIAQQLALTYPDRIEKLVLSNTAPKIGTADNWNARIDMVRQGGLASVADMVMARWFPDHFQQVHPTELAGYRAMLEQTSPVGYIRACEAIRDNDLTHAIDRISVSTLCLGGTDDGSTPPELVQAMAVRIPNARLELIDGAGHIPCLQMPHTVARLILDFVLPTGQSVYEIGMQTRRAVLGDAHVNRAEANKTDLDAAFQQYITESAWGTIWSRPGLTRRDRSLITIALLAALGHEDELAMHIRATKNTGATTDEVMEALLHTSIYAGVPVTNGAMKILKDVLNVH